MWGVGLGSLPLKEDGFPFLDVVRPDIELAALVHLLPGLLLPVLLSGLLDALPLWVGPDVWQLGSEPPREEHLLSLVGVKYCSLHLEVLV